MRHSDEFERLIDTLKVAVASLREAQIPFMLGGSMAAWARGGPEPQKDIDLIVRPSDAESVLDALVQAGMRGESPPEEWLLKAWRDDVLVDVIFRPSGMEITDEVLARADLIAVMSITVPVMALEDMLVTMLCALDEHTLDYGALVAIARSLREQINWASLLNRAGGTPFAKAFFTLVHELGIAPAQAGRARGPSHVRVLPS
ncbi:MAG: nucleotidyltransferase [Solirubrobacterales bacterium]|nr:nucleotidyltransferase [Solirubrobacterales bacterium]MBV9715372.1 nucleotidyltransferase [Solirubrobacterales bacterium]